MVMATMADAHREWHQNTGVPMGQPGCPQDACHPADDFADFTHVVHGLKGTVPCTSYEEAKTVAKALAAREGKSARIERLPAPAQADIWQIPEPPATPALSALAARMTGAPAPAPEVESCDAEASDGERPCQGHRHASVCGLDGSNSVPGIEAAMGWTPPAPEPSLAPSTEASTGSLADRAGEPKVVYDGTYTVVATDKTYMVKTQPADADFAPGKQVLGFLSGPDNERDYTYFAFIVNGHPMIWSRFKGNMALTTEARDLLRDLDGKVEREEVLLAARCFRCGHKLTVKTSIYNGYGPECAKKAGFR